MTACHRYLLLLGGNQCGSIVDNFVFFLIKLFLSVFPQGVDLGCDISKPKSLFLSCCSTPSFRDCMYVERGTIKNSLGQIFSFLP